MRIYKTWTELKTTIASKNLCMQYHEEDFYYIIFATEESTVEYFTELWKDTSQVEGINVTQNNTDKQDFEDNYKAGCNQSPYNEGQKINVQVSGGNINAVSARFRPKFYISSEEIILSYTEETELVNLIFDGKADAISTTFDKDDVEYILETNGIEILKITLEEISAIHGLDISSSFFNFPLLVRSNGKQVVIRFASPPDITENLRIKAKSIIDGEVKMLSMVVSYRERVV